MMKKEEEERREYLALRWKVIVLINSIKKVISMTSIVESAAHEDIARHKIVLRVIEKYGAKPTSVALIKT